MAQVQDERQEKAMALLAQRRSWGRAEGKHGEKGYTIPSGSRDNLRHTVSRFTCSCEDFKRGHLCYHVRAVRLAHEQDAERARQTPNYAAKAARWSAPFDKSRSVAALSARYEQIWGEGEAA